MAEFSFGIDPNFTAWGPFVNPKTFIIQPVTKGDLATAIVAFFVVIVFASSAAYVGYKQTRRSREPWKSAYIWMIWLEWASCLVMGIECLMFIMRVLRPSFYFFMSILLLWVFQTQCLLQIIVNRIRIILHDRKRGRMLMIGTLICMSLVNVSVFSIWIPARLQISAEWMHINEIWDRIEKVLYLAMDAYLNIYFIRTVKENLVRNGLQKYDKLVRFNQCMIVASLLMDVVILGCMSLPNGFVYAMFHPLAYLVKLNIEMSMARLIKKIALSSDNQQNAAGFRSFNSSSNMHKTPENAGLKTWAVQQSSSLKSMFGGDKDMSGSDGGIKKTEEFTVRSAPREELEMHSQKSSSDKKVQIGIRSIIAPGSRDEFGREFHEAKGSRARQPMSDEETLINPQPVPLPFRKSSESSAMASEISDTR
ncbi:hypothetical protein BDU57DRAFT_209823 [Ampelomyces quisqualis]|uniref:Uncharacterized protein n=1 Tax=Ampelomyces quisqualis TaxID=50730 RepID=A0A6A5QKE7_AMPQU|nr:hypothetical protein BDU57DRAFT_209823 [Ampelomyces quisqualis]